MAPFIGATETVGGALLIVGLATPPVAAALTIDMLVALFTTHIDRGFFVADGGFELVLLLAGASLTLALAGPGRYSVDTVSGLSRQLNVDAAVRLTRRLSRGSRAGVSA
jgi:putative oxidoreductase